MTTLGMTLSENQMAKTEISPKEQETESLRIRVYGIVQGVGFRPFIKRLALRHHLEGSVCNKGSYVEILAKGEELPAFLEAIPKEAPDRSVILKIKTAPISLETSDGAFTILESEKDDGLVFVSPDIATCPDCQRELLDPTDRRYLHPFINCTACGPRLTILDSMPYDRIRTSMGKFPMCPECEKEYNGIQSRRYHAQPVCCNDCGPELYLLNRTERGTKAVTETRKVIRNGGIVAIKGIGGFHLCCDGTNEEAVRRLRELKHRPYKPFAVMMRNMDVVQRECFVPDGAKALITGPQKPILLLRQKNHREVLAPGNPNLGVMLPYTPVHTLLFEYPDGETMPDILVMTSGNPSGAPICMTDREAEQYLSPMCDLILSNSRDIRIRADDSVMSWYDGKPYMIRRSRGYSPLPTILSEPLCISALGIGGELKNTFSLLKEDMVYPSPYIGDMADVRSVEALEAAVTRMERLLEIKPEVIGCDYHPKYNTVQVAQKLAEERDIPCIPVQHHYAHVVSCMAENEYSKPVIGIAFDGTGYGSDGTIWGGEILVADYDGFRRVGSIRPFWHTGGDRASKEGWRIAAALLGSEWTEKLDLGTPAERNAIRFMMANHVNAVESTSAGRLFDAVSRILDIKRVNSFEGEMSMQLQFEAERFAEEQDVTQAATEILLMEGSRIAWETCTELEDKASKDEVQKSEACSEPNASSALAIASLTDEFCYLETTRLIQQIAEAKVRGADVGQLAWMFHEELANMVQECCEGLRERTGIQTVALSGGVFQNNLLLKLCQGKLEQSGFRVLCHSLVPANDGGIALGQAVVAARQIQKRA